MSVAEHHDPSGGDEHPGREPRPPRPARGSGGGGGGGGLPEHELLKRLREGTLPAEQVRPADRRRLVEVMTLEGLSAAEIGAVLGIGLRAVYHQRKKIREANALRADPRLADLLAGELLYTARQCMDRLRRAARDREAETRDRVEAERVCFWTLDACISRLQRLGHLPTATAGQGGAATGQGPAEGEPDAALEAELERLAGLAAPQQPPSTPVPLEPPGDAEPPERAA